MARRDLKYPTLEALLAAYRTGDLQVPLVIDNDICFVYADGRKVYEGGGPDAILPEALRLLGIPHENC